MVNKVYLAERLNKDESLGMYVKRKRLEEIRPERERRIVDEMKRLGKLERIPYYAQRVYEIHFDDICGGGSVTMHTMKWFSHEGLTMIEKGLQLSEM